MKIITISGIRGGVGSSSIVAGLCVGLTQLKQRVLAIDCCRHNMLRLFFQDSFEHQNGWMKPHFEENCMLQEYLQSYQPDLDYLPFGASQQAITLTQASQLISQLRQLTQYDYVLLDFSYDHTNYLSFFSNEADLSICVLNPDANCHVHLANNAGIHTISQQHHTLHYLINRFMPTSKIQQDIHLMWSNTLRQLIPITVHQDEAFSEAFAMKQAVGQYMINSLAAHEMRQLSAWIIDELDPDELLTEVVS